MARRVFCRFCGHPAVMTAGRSPTKCEKCDGTDHWSTLPPEAFVQPRKHAKRPRMKFATTVQDYQLFLKRIRIKAE